MYAALARTWPHARLACDDAQPHRLLQTIFPAILTHGRIHLLLRGTKFQIKVWEALFHTEFGLVISCQ